MSVLKPIAKQPRTTMKTSNPKMDAVTPQDLPAPHPEVNAPHTSSIPKTATDKEEKHPKGHRVRNVADIWKVMDAQSFLHLTDTAPLMDVLVQPIEVVPSTGQYVDVKFREIINAPHIKEREAISKLSLDDLLKMLYLCDCLQWDMQGFMRISYDDWFAQKTASFITANGVVDSTNRSVICNYIITRDREFTFFPAFLKNTVGIFFRKICYHTYKTTEGENEKKVVNPSFIKCHATRGTFEYVLEARLVPLPEEWYSLVPEDEEMPPTQPL